jgi:hypothetical protein
MDQTLIILLVALLIVVAAAVFFMQSRRTKQLQSRFGPEYQRAIREAGGRSKAEALLHDREKRVSKYDIRPLAPGDRTRFSESWHRVQAQFVDDPEGAIIAADVLVGDVMTVRGYPIADFEQQAADLSVDHPAVVQNYRSAHAIALSHGRGEASTEDLRQAMIHYRSLFEELVREGPGAPTTESRKENLR